MSAYDDALKAGGVAVSETPYEAALKQGGVPVGEPGVLSRAGTIATSVWDAARGAVKAINKTTAGEADVSNIVSSPPGPAGMFNAEKTVVSGPAVPDNLIPSHVTIQDRAAFETGGKIAAGAPEDLKTLEASHVLSPAGAISTDTTPKPGLAAKIFRPSDELTPGTKNRATDIMTLSRMTNLPPSVVERNFDAVSKKVGARGTPTLEELATGLMMIGGTTFATPMAAVTGVTRYAAAKEGESWISQALQGKEPKLFQGTEAKDLIGPLAEPFQSAVSAAEIVIPGMTAFPKIISDSNWFRKLTIRDRRLVLSNAEQMKAAGMSEAEIIKIRPEEWEKSFIARDISPEQKARGGTGVETPPVTAPTPPTPPLGAPITPEVIPTPPRALEAPVPPTAVLGSPEFYKAEAAKLPGDVRYVGDMGGRPMFRDKDGAGSFTKAPEETVQEALARARARYETPQPTAEAGPVAVPEPPIPEPLANLPKTSEPEKLSTGIPQAETIKSAAVRNPKTGEVVTGPLHVDLYEKAGIDFSGDIMMAADIAKVSGFVTNTGRFVLQDEATKIAQSAKQIPPRADATGELISQANRVPPPPQTPGQKFANVRDIKSKQKKAALEPTLQQRILRAGGIKITPESRGEFAKYGLRQGEGALARLFRSEKHSGYSKAMDWSQWADTLIRDGTLGEHATIDDLMDAIKSNKRPHGAGITDEELAKEAAKSAEKVARETVPENEIALRDSFRIDGEKFKAVKYDERGRLVVKDGVEHRLGPGDDIRVDGGKEGVIPGEIPKGQQDLIKDKSFKLAEEPVPEGPAPEFKPEAAGAQDELFPGERAKYRAPEKAPPAAPPEGGLFAKGGGEEGFAPEADFRKKPGEPVDGGAPMSRSGIAKFLSEKFDIPLRVGRFRNALGIFKVGPEVIRTRFANDIEVIAHEIGHALHKFLWPEARTGSGGLAAGPLRAFQDELIPIATKPRAGGSKNAEGYAEFIRRYIVDPDEAKRVAPKFYKFFEEQLDAKSPDSKAILLEARRQYKAYFDQSGLKKLMSMISYGKDAKKKGVTTESLYRDAIDAFSEVESVVKEMSGAKKIDDVPANLNPYKKMQLMAGWKGKPDAWLEYKPYYYKSYKFMEGVKSFKEIYSPISGKVKEFDAFRVAKRAQHLGFEKTGVANESVAEGLALEKEHPEFTLAFKEIKKYRTALNRYLLDGGVIDFETYVKWKKGIDEGDYSSFAREMGYESKGKGGGASFEVKGSPVHNFKGSWRDIISPTESDIRDTYAFIHAAEKNAVVGALIDLSRQKEGMGKFVEKIPSDMQRIAVKDTELENMLRKYGKWTETTQFQTTEKVIRESIKDETGADIPAGDRGTRIMKERAVEALKTRGYSEAEANTIVARIASAKNETARSRIIERVTERATVRNTVKEFGIDIPEGLAYIYRKSPNTPRGNVITHMERGKPTFYEVDERIYSAFHALDKESANTLIRIMSIPARWLRIGATRTPEFALGKNPIRDQWTAFINSKYGYVPGVDLAKGLFTAVKKNEDYWRWKIGGGEHSAMVSMDREYFDKTWKEIMRDRGIKAETIHVVTHPMDTLQALSEYTEEATRLGEMNKGVKKELAVGKNLKTAIQDAAYGSREVTLPFSRMGAKTKAVNQIIAFWAANVADLDKIHRQFREYPLQTSIRTMAAITLPSVLLAIANHDNKKIDEIAQWQKDIFWLVDVGPFVMRIPKPFIMGILFGSFPERIVKHIMDKDPHAFDGLLASLSRGSSPGWMPTFANPIIENWANKSRFTDRQIVPRAREDLSPQYQYAPYTTETAKKIGGLLAKIPSIKGSDLENLIVSPAKLENLLRGSTGGLGMWGLRAANTSLGVAGVVPTRVEPTKKLADYPLISAFAVRYPTADSESVQRFFDDYKEAETNLKTAKFLFKKFDPKPAVEILAKEDVARLVGIKTALTVAHRIVDAVYENPKMTPEEKRRIIDQTYLNMTAIAREGNKVLDKYKEAKKAAAK